MTIEKLPFEKYRELDGINKSTLDLIDKSPAMVLWSKNCPEDKEKNNAGVFGNAFHTLILEPDEFEDRYVVAPKVDKRTKAGKAEYELFKAESVGKILLEQKEMHQLKLMQGSVVAHPEARRLIDVAQTEVTFHCNRGKYWTKSRHDGLIKSAGVSFDLKTLDIGNKDFADAWGHSVETRRYDVQEAHYREDYAFEFGEELKAFYFIVVSKTLSLGKYETRVMKNGKDMLERGLADRNKNIKTYLDCVKTGKWPGIETTVVPAYSKRG